jgi:hypothetical protein
MEPFAPLENVLIVVRISDPVNARFVFQSENGYFFESLRKDGGQFKRGGKLIRVNAFHFGSDKIQGKRVIAIE